VQTLEGGKGSTVEIIHESLVQGWPTLRRWLDENQDDAALVDQLRVAARQWQQKGFDTGLLWRGDSALEARKFRMRYKGPLSDVERGFLDAVINYELAHVRRKRAMTIGGFVGLSVLVIAAMIALVIIQKSRADAKDNFEQAEVARRDAVTALQAKERKEQERDAAEREKERIAAAKRTVDTALGKSREDLEQANEELRQERDNATESAKAAQRAQLRAEENARLAQQAREDAIGAREVAVQKTAEAKTAYQKEHDRAERLEREIGKTITVLKK
jgi:hypothetical protein